jgi:hypothetical protein
MIQKAADKVQQWLEHVYESVDYEAALIRAGVLDPNDLHQEEQQDEQFDDAEEGQVMEVNASEYSEGDALAQITDTSYLPMDTDLTIDNLAHSSESQSSGGICEGKEGELTYGEMDLTFFLSILKYLGPPQGRKFVDVGSAAYCLFKSMSFTRP